MPHESPVGAVHSLSIAASVVEQVGRLSAEIQPGVILTRRDFHQHPELGFREERTASVVAAKLRSLGFDRVTTGVGRTGVVAVLVGGRPGGVAAVRADMDALPIQETLDVPYCSLVAGVKHACGHDGHMAIALGTAELLARVRQDLPGTVKFIFQPAEEGDPDGGAGGARRMIDEGVLANPAPTAIFGLHVHPEIPTGQLGVHCGPAMASETTFTATIRGRKTHGAYPHTGLDPVPIAAQVVLALQTIPSRLMDAQQPTVVTVGAIRGGNRSNIIADSVELVGTVRSLEHGGQATVRSKMSAMLEGIASAYGAACELEYSPHPSPVTFNDPALYAASIPALAAAVGRGNVTTPHPQMGAEDFSFYQEVVPGLFFFLGTANESKGTTAMLHTDLFDIDEDALQVGVRAMGLLVMDYLARTGGR